MLLAELADLAQRLGAKVQYVRRAGQGGGLIRLASTWQLFIDSDAAPGDELARLAPQIGLKLDCSTAYVSPALRELLEDDD